MGVHDGAAADGRRRGPLRIGRVHVDDDGLITGLTLPVDADSLGEYMAVTNVAMLVLDPLTSVMDGRIDAHRDREVRTALEPLGQLAEKSGAAVLGLVHLGKGMGSDPVNLILGSRAFSAVARVALVAARDPDDEKTTCCQWRNPTSAASTYPA